MRILGLSLIIILVSLLLSKCNSNQTNQATVVQMSERALLEQLDGEWAAQNDWRDSILKFNDKRNTAFKQEQYPSYNTIRFDSKHRRLIVNTYGEFGCGTAATENLKISNSEWRLSKGFLHLAFDYADYSGKHHLEGLYAVERTGKQLILKRM